MEDNKNIETIIPNGEKCDPSRFSMSSAQTKCPYHKNEIWCDLLGDRAEGSNKICGINLQQHSNF